MNTARRTVALAGGCLLTGVPVALLPGTAAVLYALLAGTALALGAGVGGLVTARRHAGRTRAGWALIALGCLG